MDTKPIEKLGKTKIGGVMIWVIVALIIVGIIIGAKFCGAKSPAVPAAPAAQTQPAG